MSASAARSKSGSGAFDPYENVVSSSGSLANPLHFDQAYVDATTGLSHMGARYYQPSMQRWTQRDPVDNPGDTHGWNRYFYASDNPVNFADPTGRDFLFWDDLADAVGTGVGAFVLGGFGALAGAAAFGPVGAAIGFGAGSCLGGAAGYAVTAWAQNQAVSGETAGVSCAAGLLVGAVTR